MATILRGKDKPSSRRTPTPATSSIIVNAEKIVLTGRKREQKIYYRHTGYVGHLKSITADQVSRGAHPTA